MIWLSLEKMQIILESEHVGVHGIFFLLTVYGQSRLSFI